MASEEKKSGNISVESKDSGGGGSQKSMLELLTITDAAVKALNKSTSSHGSKKSQHSDQLRLSTHSDRSAKSADSGHSRSTVSSQQISDQSVKSADLHQDGHNGQLDSDRSLRSQLSQRSAASGHSTRSYQSGQSGHSSQSRSDRDIKLAQPLHDTSHDSGVISKTQTVSEEKSKSGGVTLTAPTDDLSSDVSTTASDVLIRSTLDKSERSILAEGQNGVNGNGSSSISSKCSRTSFGVENFNSTGPQKVKISKKHLREIKPPFQDGSPTSSASSDGKVPSALLSRTGKQNSQSGYQRKGAEKEAINISNNANGNKFPAGKSFPVGVDTAEQFKVDKVRKSAEKAYEDINMVPKTKSRPNGAHIPIDDKFIKKPQSTAASSGGGEVKVNVVKEKTTEPAKKDTKISDEDIMYRSTPKYYVERHTPQKSQPRIASGRKEEEIPEKRNLLQDLEDSVEIITAHARDSSASSSQPEIVTVPERIVTVSAKSSLSSASASNESVSKSSPPVETCHSVGFKLRNDRGCLWDEKEKLLDDSTTIPPALNRHQADDDRDGIKEADSRPLPARFQWFSRQAHGHGLQQGAPVNGPEAPDKQKDEDVHISDFKLTEKQRVARETFARRQGGPIRRVVQPHIVSHDSKASATSNTGELKSQPTLGQANDQVLTAAAAASAAVAATQPFLKAQYDMENKMAELLAKINELQSKSSEKHSPTERETEKERIGQLERQLADMTEKRIEYMERLQEQQMAMQAKLLFMTRESTYARPYHPRSYSPESNLTSAPVPNKVFSKTTVSRQPHSRDHYQKSSVLDLEESDSPLDTPAPRARAPKPTFYDNSDIEYRIGKARSPNAKSRSPKSKSPQRRHQSPSRLIPDRGILHQILASAESPTRNGSPNIRTRLDEECESPNVRKAKTLIEDLSHIKEQVKGLVEEKERWQPSAKESSAEKPANVNLSHTGPSPLDSYLYFPKNSSASPYKSVPDLSFSKINAPVLPGFKEAENILRQVQQNRGFLESNFEAVMRARQEVEVYSMFEAVYNDSTDQEKTRIKKMVDKSIQKLRREVEREVTDDMVISEIRKKGASNVPGAVKIPEPEQVSKPTNKFGVRGRVQQPKVEQKPEVKKPSAAGGKRPGVGGKENVHKFYRPPPKKKSVFEDEETMTRIYGKASYQKGRTTVKDPYLHFQNMAKQKAPRPMGHAEVQGTEMMSSKTQTVSGGQTSGGAVRQFYFNPATGMYIPIASAADAAPIPGQLIPMAVPLGGPRMDSGLTVPSTMTSTPVAFSQGHRPQVTADGNVSMVSVGMEDDGKMRPELGKQVLPAVDIDTDISETSEIIDEDVLPSVPAPRSPEAKPKKHVQIVSPRGTPNRTPARSAGKAHYEVVYHEGSSAEEPDREKKEEDSITISRPSVTHSNHQNHDSVSLAREVDRKKKEEESITISHPTVTHSNHRNSDSVSSAKEPDREKKEEDSITVSHPTVTHSNQQNHDSVSLATVVDRQKKEEDSITLSHPTITYSSHQNHDSRSSAKESDREKKKEDSITISHPTVSHSNHQNHDSGLSATEVVEEMTEVDSITISHPAVTRSNHQNHDSVSSATEIDREMTEEDSIIMSHPTVTHSNHQNHDSVRDESVSLATEVDREKKEEDSITISHPAVTHSNHQNHDSVSLATEPDREKKEEDSITISHPTFTHSSHQNRDSVMDDSIKTCLTHIECSTHSVSLATEPDRKKKEEDNITLSHPTVTHSYHQDRDSVSTAKKPDREKKEEDSITISHPTVTHSNHQNHGCVREGSIRECLTRVERSTHSVSLATEEDRKKKEEDSITMSHPTVTHFNHQNHDSVSTAKKPDGEKKEEESITISYPTVSTARETDREKKEEESITISYPTVSHSYQQNHDSVRDDSVSTARETDREKKEEDSVTISHSTVTHSSHQSHSSVRACLTHVERSIHSVSAATEIDRAKKEEDSITLSHPTVTHSIHPNNSSVRDDSGRACLKHVERSTHSVSSAKEPDREKKREDSITTSHSTVTHSKNQNHDSNFSAKEPDREKKEEDSITISHPAVTHSNHQNHDSDDTLVDEDADVETATGLEFPGYQPEEVPEVQYNGPSFPPKLPSAERQLTSDLIAEDIKRRDLLQNKASEWIEQELMARIISELYPLRDTDEPHEISHVVSEESEDSMAEEREKSMFVMDTIGHRGMQLFVDAGCPVDNTLVNRLIEEVLKEKVRTMLGQRPEAEDQTQPRRQDEGPQWEEPVSEEISEVSARRSVVSTPEPTPRASPRHSPPHRVSPAPTPLASPPPGTPRVREEVFEPPEPAPVVRQPVVLPVEPESEPESSASYDIQEELARLADKLRPNVDASASIQSRHDVATPPESPSPEPEPLMTTRPLTPPELSPRPVHEEPFVMPQNIVPAGTSLDQTPSRISKTKTESPKSATSPQVTEMAEEELAEDQPKAVVLTVAETQTDKLAETREKSRSPSPTKSRTPSESSYTESSSISDTFNECVSEGQWLINKSDGEVADFPIDEVAVRERMLRMSQKRVDVSSASTWKDIDDVDLDQETDASKSEGEFLYRTDFPPEKDPVLDMLARLQSAGPKFGMYPMSQRQVTDVLNTTGKSEGEVLRVSAASQPYQHIPEQETIFVAPKRSKSPKSPRTRSPEGGVMPQRGVSSPRKGGASQKRSQSPVYRTQSPTRVSFEDMLTDQPQRSTSPTRGILKRSSSFDGQPVRDDFQFPERDSGRSRTPTGRSLTSSGRMMQGERQPQAKGMIGAGARSMSPGKSGMRRPIKSSTMPESRGQGSRMLNLRTSSEDYRDSLENTGGPSYYSGEYSARNMTPDQMNVDALIQSGYLSQSFSQSENGRQTGQSSVRNSVDLRQSRDSAGQRSLGYSYGTDGSLSMSELQRLATEGTGTGKLKMSLTIPGTEADDSELSEIDITDGGNTQ